MTKRGTIALIFIYQSKIQMSHFSLESHIGLSLEFFKNLPGYVFFKDKDCRFRGCNETFAKDSGCESIEDIIGRTDYDFPLTNSEAEKYQKDDKRVIETGKLLLNEIEIHLGQDHQKYKVRVNKYPLLDHQKKICGLYGDYQYLDINLSGNSREYQLQGKNKIFRLSPREVDCAIAMIEGRSARETALQYAISQRTVESYIENIKNKLGCNLKSELIRTLLKSTFINEITGH